MDSHLAPSWSAGHEFQCLKLFLIIFTFILDITHEERQPSFQKGQFHYNEKHQRIV